MAGAALTRQQALQTAATIAYAYRNAYTLLAIAEEQAKGGDVSGALKTAASIGDAYQKARALGRIAADGPCRPAGFPAC